MSKNLTSPLIAIACGGTGGHLFPGLAVAEKLQQHDCDVTLIISAKDVDQQAVKTAARMTILTLPAVGLQRGSGWAFTRGFHRSLRVARQAFKTRRPCAILAMGGFTSAPPVIAGRMCGARTFLHESNTIPGRANRWLSWLVNSVFIGFPSAGKSLHNRRVTITGTPVRPCFRPRDSRACKEELGLDPARPVVLVVGGSQGATGLNKMVLAALPSFSKHAPGVQFFHLAGPNNADQMRHAYAAAGIGAVVHPFFSEMEIALAGADAAISRAGASSLAELAALRLPSILIPYPSATDDHQLHNALAFVETGAARLIEQSSTHAEMLAPLIVDLLRNQVVREAMQTALSKWQTPRAADRIAEHVLRDLGLGLANHGSFLPEPQRTFPDEAIIAPSFQGGLSV